MPLSTAPADGTAGIGLPEGIAATGINWPLLVGTGAVIAAGIGVARWTTRKVLGKN